jgi:hypothetical protein
MCLNSVLNTPLFWMIIGVIAATAFVGTVFGNAGGDNKTTVSWKVRVGLLLGGALIALLGTAAGSGIAGFLKIPFNVASGKF